jgi:hypothetical protein
MTGPPAFSDTPQGRREAFIANVGREPTLYDETSWGIPATPPTAVQVPPTPKGQREVHIVLTVLGDTDQEARGRVYARMGKPHPRVNNWRFDGV